MPKKNDITNTKSAKGGKKKGPDKDQGQEIAKELKPDKASGMDQETDATGDETNDPEPSESETEEPMTEALTYMGMDSTAVIDIAFVQPDMPDESEKAMATWIQKIDKPKKGQKVDKAKAIQDGISLIEVLVSDSNRLINLAAKSVAEKALIIGSACLRLKELTKGSGVPWGTWADENLPFLATRNRQKFMLLAKRTDCHPFTHLGVDRMEILCSITKSSEEEDPIGALFSKYSITFDEKSDESMSDFKKKIDAAVGHERLLKKGVEIDFDLVGQAIDSGVKIDKGLIKRLKDIQKCGGNPATLFEDLGSKEGDDDPDADTEKRIQDFNSLSTRLIETIDYLVKDAENQDPTDFDHLETLDVDTFEILIAKLEKLKEVSKLLSEETQGD